MRCTAGMRVCVTEPYYYGMEYERIADRTPCTGHSYGGDEVFNCDKWNVQIKKKIELMIFDTDSKSQQHVFMVQRQRLTYLNFLYLCNFNKYFVFFISNV